MSSRKNWPVILLSIFFVLSTFLGGLPVSAGQDPVEVTGQEFSIDVSFNMKKLEKNKILNARVNVQNNTSKEKPVLAIAALYDESNALVDVSGDSKIIKNGKSKSIHVQLRLPENVTNHHVKVFASEGTDLDSSNMIPLSNIVTL
ncbi:hypothetical protein V7111_15130, partial [Neobacillus niacini]|uniref:hypothetical protein n=1 Tax=Neobacillus niacini TaxID=86668 RepID=UPI00300242D8